MPTNWPAGYRDISPWLRAWTRHYIAKGCHPIKARDVASKRCRRKLTMPPN